MRYRIYHNAGHRHRQIGPRRVHHKVVRKLVFEPDTNELQTIESLAMQQRTFLAANQQEQVERELMERFQIEDIEWMLRHKAMDRLSIEFQQRYQELIDKRRNESLTEAEYVELLRLTNEAERKQAERLEA